MGTPNVYPMGTTIYNPEKAWSGYTIMSVVDIGAVLIDMNGNVVRTWKDFQGFPNKMLPGGHLMGSLGRRREQYGYQDMADVTEIDWDGNVVWSFNQKEFIKDDEKEYWLARQHHDYQREGNPVGYYAPGMECQTHSGNTLILCHEDVYNKRISDKRLLDDVIVEVDWEGNIVWKWNVSDHFSELGFDEMQKTVLFRNPNYHPIGKEGQSDWMHINSMSVLGPNKWYDAGDERFHPDNIIWDGRQTNIIAIISKETGKIVWKLGADYTTGKAKEIGQIIGQHHAHMIPQGLPGAGNILLFDNGGWAGYGAPNPVSLTGVNNAHRDYSRVLEIDPVAMEIVWQCRPMDLGYPQPFVADHFYSCYISSAQRLPNGNTLITEGSDGRLLEVTPEHEIVWEYISPYFGSVGIKTNMVYRAYRYPYDYVPQVEPPKEVAIKPVDNEDFRLPGAKSKEFRRMVQVEGVEDYAEVSGFCLATEED